MLRHGRVGVLVDEPGFVLEVVQLPTDLVGDRDDLLAAHPVGVVRQHVLPGRAERGLLMLGQCGQPPVEAEQLRVLEGAATGVKERPERCDVELQTLIGAEALNEMAAVFDGGQRLLWGLSRQADHEEQVEFLAPLGQ